ncbi:MAG: hypothetical protein IPJ58_13270 [Ardenticatenia bacterium]|nr:hypothetical protein [Ardenticatenia bacterium]
MEIDARGLVWVASWQGGVLRYEPTRDRWTDYFSDQTVNGQVSAMAADAGGSVWSGVTDAEAVPRRWCGAIHPGAGRR